MYSTFSPSWLVHCGCSARVLPAAAAAAHLFKDSSWLFNEKDLSWLNGTTDTHRAKVQTALWIFNSCRLMNVSTASCQWLEKYRCSVVLKSCVHDFRCALLPLLPVSRIVLWLYEQDSVIGNCQNTINPKQLVSSRSSARSLASDLQRRCKERFPHYRHDEQQPIRTIIKQVKGARMFHHDVLPRLAFRTWRHKLFRGLDQHKVSVNWQRAECTRKRNSSQSWVRLCQTFFGVRRGNKRFCWLSVKPSACAGHSRKMSEQHIRNSDHFKLGLSHYYIFSTHTIPIF